MLIINRVTRLAGMLGECKALAHLDFKSNTIGVEGAGRLAGVRHWLTLT